MFPLTICFTRSSVYKSMLLSVCPTLSFPTMSTVCFFTSASPFLPCKQVHQYRFHIYVTIQYFSLSDLLHSMCQTLGSSTSLQMTQFCSFLWLSNIPSYACTTSSLSIHQRTFRLLHFLAIVLMNIGAYVSIISF